MLAARFVKFSLVGVVSTLAFVLLYAALRTSVSPLVADVGALTSTMAGNFLANRRFTFNQHPGSLSTQAGRYAVAYFVGLVASTLAFAMLLALFSPVGGAAEATLAVGSGGVATVVRFLLSALWVFRE